MAQVLSAARHDSSDAPCGATILIVQDRTFGARVVQNAAAEMNCTMLMAYNDGEVWALIQHHEPDLIIIHVDIEDFDALNLLSEVKTTSRLHDTPVIALTRGTRLLIEAESYALGADVVIRLPSSSPVLQTVMSSHVASAIERRRRSLIDDMTLLPNRTAFLDALDRASTLGARNREPVAICMIDLDHFKSVNDRYGHNAGDDVLVACAQMIQQCLRTSDFVARWGGEEFSAFLPNTTTAGALIALNKALEAVRLAELRTAAGIVRVSFSAGIAELEPGGDVQLALHEADRLLYVAKAEGRDRVVTSSGQAL